MNTEERFLTALKCKQPDRVPVTLFLNPYTKNWATEDKSYTKLMDAVKEYSDVVYDWHFPFGHFNTAVVKDYKTEDIGSGKIKQSINAPKGELCRIIQDKFGGGTEKHWIESLEDAEKVLSIPYVPCRPDLNEFFKTKKELKDKAVAQVTLPDPICIVGDLFKPEMFCTFSIENRDLIIKMLDEFKKRILDEIDYLIKNDVGPVYYFNGPEYVLPPLMSPLDFNDFVVDYDTEIIQKINKAGKYTIIHSHGKVNKFLDSFLKIGPSGLNVLEPPPSGDIILADAKKKIGKKICMIGNIQYDDLARASLAQVEKLVKDCMDAAKEGGGFIISPCASPYESPIPEKTAENLIHYLKMANKYGKY